MDVIDLKEFYAQGLGSAARRLIAHRIRTRWSDLRGLKVAGVGYATPYLGVWRDEASALLGLMPARQGVVHWPDRGNGAAALVDESDLPLPDSSIDRVLVVHGLELWDGIDETLREIWRVLKPEGRLLLVVPNRRGMWARFDTTPFGHGRPFSRKQLVDHLRESMFSPSGWANALFMPPFDRAFLRRSAAAWERLGLWLWPGFSGVIIVEATKHVYGLSGAKRAEARRLRPGLAPVPAAAPRVAFDRVPRRGAQQP